MILTQPIVFEPLFMERVWGGRRLETLFGKRLPPNDRIGESWEIVDREDAQSVVHEGPLRGRTLHELWTGHREMVFGRRLPDAARFPLLFKILDAQDRLSVQVHPPPDVAARLGGESKTEMWYVMDAVPDAEIYAGLERGVSRGAFERALAEGRVAELVHQLRVRQGDALFIPSGRIHAIGAGNLIFEVQENSDTTYRVFDWNRLGLDGKPRALHVEESLQAINFDDPVPAAITPRGEHLVECEHFRVEKWELDRPRASGSDGFAVFAVLNGRVDCAGRVFEPGEFFLVPPSMSEPALKPLAPATSVLRTMAGESA